MSTHTLTELEYLRDECARQGPVTKAITDVLHRATDDLLNSGTETPELGWREHREIIDAYRNGLSWYINMTGGYALYTAWRQYLAVLKRHGFYGESFDSTFEEEGIE